MKTPLLAHTRLSLSRIGPAVIWGLSLALPASLALAQTSGTWTSTTGGDWSNIANWSSGSGPVATSGSTSANVTATFSASGTQTINLDTNQTVQKLAFSTGTYTLSSSNGSVLTLAGTTTPSFDGSATISVSIAGAQGFSFAPSGYRNITLSGNNTYTGVTAISSGGRLIIKSDSALGASGTGNSTSVTTNDGADTYLSFDSSAASLNISEELSLRINTSGNLTTPVGAYFIRNVSTSNSTTLTGPITIDRTSSTTTGRAATDYFGIQAVGILNIEGAITGAASAGQTTSVGVDPTRLQLNATLATGNINISGAISGGTITTGGLSVYTATTNLGVVRLSAANTYTGSTVHQKGTLLINNTTGSGTGTGAVSVASTAIFGGTGIVVPTGANGVTFASGAIVSPGNLNADGTAIAAGENLTFDLAGTTGTVSFDAGSSIFINLNSAAVLPADVSEHLAFIGLTTGVSQVTFNNNIVNFSFTGGMIPTGVYTLASFSADNAYTGEWVLGSGLEGYTAQLIKTANSIQVSISAIPEPATTAVLAGLVMIGAAVATKRRRS